MQSRHLQKIDITQAKLVLCSSSEFLPSHIQSSLSNKNSLIVRLDSYRNEITPEKDWVLVLAEMAEADISPVLSSLATNVDPILPDIPLGLMDALHAKQLICLLLNHKEIFVLSGEGYSHTPTH